MLNLGRDPDDLRWANLIFDFGKADHVEPAIWAPMTAVEREDHRPSGEQLVEAREATLLVGHGEVRHRLANLRRAFTGARRLQPLNELIDRHGEAGSFFTNAIGDELQPLAQRCIETADLLKRVFERGDERMNHS